MRHSAVDALYRSSLLRLQELCRPSGYRLKSWFLVLVTVSVCCHAVETRGSEAVLRKVSRTSWQASRGAVPGDSPFLLDLDERPMEQVGTNIQNTAGRQPTDLASGRLEKIDATLGEEVMDRYWNTTALHWHAPAFAHRPLYFEQVNLERFGYGPRYLRVVQPALSGAHFFATVPALPYLMTVRPPGSCVYPLGHYRPGNCVPYQWQRPEWSAPAGLMEAGTWIGLALLIP